MRFNRQTLLLLVVGVVVIVIALVALSNTATAPDDDATTEDTSGDFFADISVDDLTEVTITDADGTSITLTRSNSDVAWAISDSDDEADQTELTSALTSLVDLRYTNSFSPEESDRAQFGFGEDATLAQISFTAGEETYTLNIGGQNPGGTRYYVSQPETPDTLYLVAIGTLNTLLGWPSAPPVVVPPTPTPQPALNLPGPVFGDSINFTAFNRFEVRDNESGESLVLVKDEDMDQWTIEGDERTLDQILVDVRLSSFAVLEGVQAIDAPDLAALELEDPAATIIASTPGLEYRLQLGGLDPSGALRYALVNDFERVAVINAEDVTGVLDWLNDPPLAPEPTPEPTAEADAEAEGDPEADAEAPDAEVTEEATGEGN